ncbi:MAG: hypothetical protein JRI96_11380 [Deltaproteobacteria bacterium]|nr:hypothetical protein [Deltaproteobacteria bacterium]
MINLSDAGFLVDPDEEHGWAHTDVVPFERIAHYPCLALLGEPGIGKSMAMEDLRTVLQNSLKSSNDQLLYIDLSEYGDESRLIGDIFEGQTFNNWKNGTHELHLLLDSLDECRIQIPQVATIMINRFGHVRTLLPRLRLRIACRTAEWPATLEKSLPELWGEDNFRAFELAALRRKDVKAAVEAKGIQTEKFFLELERTEAVPLAIKPITLDFLLSVFKKDGSFPATRFELYEEGCKLLCEEFNPRRQDLRPVGGTGMFSAEERLIVASRIAAISIFCRKPTIRTGHPSDLLSDEEVSVSALTGGKETWGSRSFDVSEDHIREALGTGLFSSRGAYRMGFAHQTYAEFLTCRYLDMHHTSSHKILNLLYHPDDPKKSIIPQLYETAAWISDKNKDVLKAIAYSEPQILLRSDGAALTTQDRATIVSSLLEALQDRRADDRDWNLRRHYGKLIHSGLANQLLPWITGSDKHIVARRAAMDIAVACEVRDLQSALADTALDQTVFEGLRDIAANGVATIGDAATRERLRPFVFGQGGEDPNDQLKGAALKALWPELITAREVFDNLTLPKEEFFYGSYLYFIGYELLEHLEIDDLPLAIEWVRAHSVNEGLGLRMGRFGDRVMILAWKHMDNSEVFEALADLAVGLLKNHHGLLENQSQRIENEALFNDPTKRRKLAKAIIQRSGSSRINFELIYLWPRLVRFEDFEWCVQELLSSTSQPVESIWAELVWDLFRWAEPSVSWLDAIFRARTESPELRNRSELFFTPVDLNSERAREMKEEYQRIQQRQRKREPKVLEWLPKDRIQHYLERLEMGEQDVWWVLLREMTLEDTTVRYDHEKIFKSDIRKLPGWINSGDKTREKILDAAESFLHTLQPFDPAHLYDGKANEKDAAVYKAFLVLLNLRPDKITSLPEEVWEYWSPVFFGPFGFDDDKTTQRRLISMAYERIPDRIIHILKEIIRHQAGKGDDLPILEELEELYDQSIRDVIYDILDETEANPRCWGKLIMTLTSHGDPKATEIAKGKISLPLPEKDVVGRQLALQSTLALIQCMDDAGWEVVWPVLKQELEFGREVMMELAPNLNRRIPEFASKLSESQLAEFFIWLVGQFPYSEDRKPKGVYTPSRDDMVRDFRDDLLRFLEKAGTPTSCLTIDRISKALPELDWIKSALIEARHNMLRQTWRPIQPKELLEFIAQPESVMVRNADELQELIVDTLSGLEQILQGETPAAPDLWDQIDRKRGQEKFRPKDENHFSDWVKRNLDAKLRGHGIIAAREVQIRQGEGSGIGEKTDIHVTAVVPGLTEDNWEQVRVIIEAKGCWNRDLTKAMQTQLVNRYLRDNQCKHGIYLVGWYDCEQWEVGDRRKSDTPRWSIQKARQFFTQQASDLSSGDLRIRAVVINAALR